MPSGGKRENAGRKLKYGEATKTVAFRVPVSMIEDLKKHVKNEFEKRKNSNTTHFQQK